jgi:hypothetical protein
MSIKKIILWLWNRFVGICKRLFNKKETAFSKAGDEREIVKREEKKKEDKQKEEKKENKKKPKKKSVTRTIFPYSVYNFMVGYVPWDLDGFVIPFQDGTNWNMNRFEFVGEESAKRGVNVIRLFAYCQERPDSIYRYIQPLEIRNDRYIYRFRNGRLILSPAYVNEMSRRLRVFHERGIVTIICLASGIKGFRYHFSMWNGRNSNIKSPSRPRAFIEDELVIAMFKDYCQAMVEHFDNPLVIWELINEPHEFEPKPLTQWTYHMIDYLTKKLKVPQKRIMVQHIDRSLDGDDPAGYKWLKKYKKILYSHHGINTAWAFIRYHRHDRDFYKYFYKPFGRRIVCDSDGAQTYEAGLIGTGLIGKNWNPEFRRPSSFDMYHGLVYDYRNGGGGWIIMSAAAWVRSTTIPNIATWRKSALEGLTREECRKYGVSFELNKEPELRAIERAVREIIRERQT